MAPVAPYCASKWAVEGLTKSVAKEVPSGMAIVALIPGVINTDMLASCFGSSSSLYQAPDSWAPKAADMILNLTMADNGSSLSRTKLKEARQSAGSFVGEVAKDAKGNVSKVAERVGSVVKSRWSLFQQPSTRQAMQERLVSAAATTSFFLRRGVSETKEKVVVGKSKVEEVAKKTTQKSKTLLTDIELWQKVVASTDVFGVPLEVTVQRQDSTKPVPFLLVKCADFLILSGLNSPDLFKSEGNKKVIQQLT